MTFYAVDTDVVREWKMTDSIGNNTYHVIMIELGMSRASDWFSLLFLDQIQAMPIYSLQVYLGLYRICVNFVFQSISIVFGKIAL